MDDGKLEAQGGSSHIKSSMTLIKPEVWRLY